MEKLSVSDYLEPKITFQKYAPIQDAKGYEDPN